MKATHILFKKLILASSNYDDERMAENAVYSAILFECIMTQFFQHDVVLAFSFITLWKFRNQQSIVNATFRLLTNINFQMRSCSNVIEAIKYIGIEHQFVCKQICYQFFLAVILTIWKSHKSGMEFLVLLTQWLSYLDPGNGRANLFDLRDLSQLNK